METSIDLKIGLSAKDKLKMKEDILNIVKPSLKPAGTDTSTNILNFEEDKGMYVATDNGYWYYWNGSAYVYGGLFQAPEIPDGSITPEKTNFIGIGNNILNEDDITYDSKYIGSTGNIVAQDRFRTYVVKLKVGTAYTISMTQATGDRFFYLGFATSPTYSYGTMADFVSGSWYDSSATATKLQYTFTAEYEYLILSTFKVSEVPTIMLNEGSTALPYEKYKYILNVEGKNDDNFNKEINDLNKATLNKTFIDRGYNLFDKNNAKTIGYYNYSNGVFNGNDTNYRSTDYIPVKPNTTYWNNKLAHITFWNENKKYVGGAVNTGSIFFTFTTTEDTSYIILSVGEGNVKSSMLCEGDTQLKYYEDFTYILNKVKSQSENETLFYTFPYVYNQKLCCNRTTETRTAHYATIDFGEVPTKLSTKFIFEVGSLHSSYGNSGGVVALICNPNGANKVTDITYNSLHLILTRTHITLQCLGESYGKYYYCTLISQDITGIPLDGTTENELTMTINGEEVTVTVNGVSYSGTFTDTDNLGLKLSDFTGRYCTIEHYCDGDRNRISMPMFTEFKVFGNTKVPAFDNFKRENGIISSMPTGHIYHLMTNVYDGNKIK